MNDETEVAGSIAKDILEQFSLKIKGGIAYLIVCRGNYYCGPGDWCGNSQHARRFRTREEAEKVAKWLPTLEPRTVEEHMWEEQPR